ncbi:MAG: hypothetical protein A4E42_00367 [Methanoregulaceae archaeon PtaU1.Bin222]|nr:MAG: hypothetical protein A4E42_00367 [Methanoregulaceae archaeon PtaU1.Bin222]
MYFDSPAPCFLVTYRGKFDHLPGRGAYAKCSVRPNGDVPNPLIFKYDIARRYAGGDTESTFQPVCRPFICEVYSRIDIQVFDLPVDRDARHPFRWIIPYQEIHTPITMVETFDFRGRICT